jgi:hypothetical protein
MRDRKWSRRDVLKTTTALAAGALFAEPARAATPPPASVTPELIAAAQKEGKVSYYSALELNVAERLGKAFEAKYPGISVRVERSGAERIYQRIAQEQGSGINAVDVANSTDPAHYLDWKSKDWLAPYLPDDVAKYFPADQFDPDGTYATSCAWLEVIGYNTKLVKAEDAPKSYADLLEPKWQGKIVKAHPGYSGAIMTATFVRHFQERAEPECGAAVSKLLLQPGRAAIAGRQLRASLLPFRDQGEAWPPAALFDQAAQVRSCGGAGPKRGHQGALYQAVQGIGVRVEFSCRPAQEMRGLAGPAI